MQLLNAYRFDKVPGKSRFLRSDPVRLKPLLKKIESGEIDPSFVITHRVKLDDAPEMYKTFRDKKDGCIKVVLQP